MNARGNSLLIEEKERNRVNKLLPKLEKELQDLIQGMDMDIVSVAEPEPVGAGTFLVGAGAGVKM